MSDELRCIVIDETAAKRDELVTLIKTSAYFKEIRETRTLDGSMGLLENSVSNVDCVFVKHIFEDGELGSFVNKFESHECGHSTAFILLLEDPDHPLVTDEEAVHKLGCHSVLIPPLSEQKIREIVAILMHLRPELLAKRDLLKLMEKIKLAMKGIDTASQLKKAEQQSTLAEQEVKAISTEIKEILAKNARLSERYFEQLIEEMISAEVPWFLPGMENYTGKSQATKRRAKKFKEKLADDKFRDKVKQERAKRRDSDVQDESEPEILDNGMVAPPSLK